MPMALVTALWQATGALDETAARSLCKQMADLSLLAIDTTLPGGAVTLHDVVRDYLRAELGTTGLAAADTALLDATAATLPPAEDGGVAWWQTTTGYLQDHLIEHLLDARRTTQAMAVAGDFRWMRARLHQRGPTAAWRDLDRVGAPTGTLARQLASAAHLLTPTTPPDALDAILLSRVPDALNRPTSPRPTDPPALIDRWMPPDLPDPALLQPAHRRRRTRGREPGRGVAGHPTPRDRPDLGSHRRTRASHSLGAHGLGDLDGRQSGRRLARDHQLRRNPPDLGPGRRTTASPPRRPHQQGGRFHLAGGGAGRHLVRHVRQ